MDLSGREQVHNRETAPEHDKQRGETDTQTDRRNGTERHTVTKKDKKTEPGPPQRDRARKSETEIHIGKTDIQKERKEAGDNDSKQD